MPKLIVYVKAETWRRVEAGYGEDAASLMRNLSVEAIEAFVNGTKESGVADVAASSPTESAAVAPRVTAPDDHFKPDFKKAAK